MMSPVCHSPPHSLAPRSHFQVLEDATDANDHLLIGEHFEVLPQHLLCRQPWEVAKG